MKACSTCEHYAAMKRECRANPPTVFVVGNAKQEPVAIAFFAPMPPEGWCGSWLADIKIA